MYYELREDFKRETCSNGGSMMVGSVGFILPFESTEMQETSSNPR